MLAGLLVKIPVEGGLGAAPRHALLLFLNGLQNVLDWGERLGQIFLYVGFRIVSSAFNVQSAP